MQILEEVSVFYLRNSHISLEGRLILTCIVPNLHSMEKVSIALELIWMKRTKQMEAGNIH